MLKCLIALTSSLAALTAAAQVFTWVDENGVRHYSDRAVDGATRIEIASPQTFTAPRVEIAESLSSSAGQPEDSSYSVLDFVSPTDQESLFNIEGNLGVSLAVAPALRPGHTIDVLLDGEPVIRGAQSLAFTITDVFRGEHTLQFSILDANGEVLQRSSPITFFVRQNSIQAPLPRNPAPGVGRPLRPN